MTFKGMLKILVNDYKKQYDEKMFSIADELIRTRRELREVKEQLHTLQLGSSSSSSDIEILAVPTISLFIQYKGFFNELCDIRQTMTVKELLNKLRPITGIPFNHPIRLRVLSEDGLTTLFFLDDELDRTLESYDDDLKPRMILSIEHNDDIDCKRNSRQRSKSLESTKRTYSYESDV
ncbi:unnamed protein product [Rotaria sp. Silwood1]|nr:unnamed protein product [Rotaria sp. Silwood1]CAF3523564.1 unnamed protein product [Rotaria sp. Silwood1]